MIVHLYYKRTFALKYQFAVQFWKANISVLKMPKEKRSVNAVLNQFVKDFSDFTTDGSVLFCKYCEVSVTATKKFQVTQHLQTSKHQKKKNRSLGSKQQQMLVQAISKPGPNRSPFNEELCEVLISADIPLAKLRNEKFKTFLEKHTKQHIPDESTLRKNYVLPLYNATIQKLREKANDKNIWISLDETTDVEQRSIANFVFGILGVEEERNKSYLLTMKVLQKVNHSTIATFFNDALSFLWPTGICYEKVLVVCTDAAPYMCKAMSGLKILYSKMTHVTCVAHGLHRVAELVRSVYTNVNFLISSTKKVFLKAPSRVAKFKEIAGSEIPLPPSPIVTRWGTWIEAASYYARHFELIARIVNDFDPDEAQCVEDAQNALKRSGLREDLIYIQLNLTCISETILKLETKGLCLEKSIQLVENVFDRLNKFKNSNSANKMSSVLDKNTGYQNLKNISKILQDQETAVAPNNLNLTDIVNLSFAPIVSCDVERCFSEFKNILGDNRRKFTFDNLLHHVVVKCNSKNL